MNKKTRLVAAYLKGLPVWCSWQVTPRCESACVFCDHRAEAGANESDLETCRRIVRELSSLGSLLVSLSGGEPFLRADLPELVSMLAASHFPLLTTSGCLVTRERAGAVWEAGLEAASVSLDHVDPQRQDSVAGVPGAYKRAIAGLLALSRERRRSSQRVNVKTRVTSDDLRSLPDLLRLAADHGATVSVEPAFPLPTPGESGAGLADRLRELKARHGNLRTGSHFLAHVDEALDGGVGGCQAGRAFFNVDHRGRVSKCLEFRGPEDRVGGLESESMSALIPRLRQVQAVNQCRSCWYAFRGEVEGLYTLRGLLGALPELVRA